ncbi:MAG TPA: Tad domain-containing protein [Dehalococcoidia bacterium]|nr:Tad domain-containing protein [Dehalococcoidia bacterium]
MNSAKTTVQPDVDESGQILIFMVLAMSVVFIIGAITVDVGLWLSERRGAQTDADFVALAGAWELIDPGAAEADAIAAATAALTGNDEQGNATFVDEPEVDLAERCVSVDVDHGSRPLFFQIFGLANPEIGAHARACAGGIQNLGPGGSPFQITNDTAPCFNDDETPNFTIFCPLEFGAQGGDTASRGLVDTSAPGDYCSDTHGGVNTTTDHIANGIPGTCFINTAGSCNPGSVGPWYDCVSIQPGNAKDVTDGVYLRISREGACDEDGDGIDSFEESVVMVIDTGDPLTSIYEARDCDPSTSEKEISPRLIMIFVLDEDPGGNSSTGHPIYGFAGFYLGGCANETYGDITDPLDPRLDPKCQTLGNPGGGGPGGGPGGGGSDGGGEEPPGKSVVYGRFVNLITSGGGIVPPNDSTTIFGIALVE